MSSLSVGAGEQPRVGAILLGCVLGFLVGEVVATALLSIGVAIDHYPGGLSVLAKVSQPPWWANVLSLVGLWIGFGGAIAYALVGGGLHAMIDQWRLRASDVGYVALGVACQGAVVLAYLPFHVAHLNRPTKHLLGSAQGASFALLGLLTVVGSPLIEEWFFRGVLYRALRRGLDRYRPWVATTIAMVLSAVLFAAAHGEPAQFVGLVFLGVVLALLVQRTNRLTPSIITHMSFNAVALVALLAQRSGG